MSRHRRGIVISLVAVLVHATVFYAILAYLPSYVQRGLGLDRRTAFVVVVCGIFVYICAVSFAVRVTDQRGQRRNLIVALLIFILPESIQELLTNHRRDTAITFGVSCLNAVAFYMLLSYMPTYVHEELGFSQDTATLATSIMLVVYIGSIFIMGHLSDSFGRRQMLIAACVAFLVLTIPLFLIMTRVAGMFIAVVLCQIVFAIALTANDGTLATFLAESFPTNVRYSGFALSFNGANAILGGTTPFIVTWLIKVTGSPLAPAVYLTVIALFAMVAIFMSRTIHGSELTESNTGS
jgi:MFS transporter